MSNKAYNIILVILILIIVAGAYVIFTRKEYTENVEVSTPVTMNTTEEKESPAPETKTPTPEIPTPKPEAPAPKLQAEASASLAEPETITYTSLGFSPRTLTVTIGTRVIFVNDNDMPMWVASSPYPSHSNYPSFDQRRAAGKGSMYSFTFTKAGAYNYQNDKNPSHTGTIIVTE